MVAKRLFLFFFVKILVTILSRIFKILVLPKLLESNDLIIVVRLDHDNLVVVLKSKLVVVYGVGIIQSQPALILLAKDLYNILRGVWHETYLTTGKSQSLQWCHWQKL